MNFIEFMKKINHLNIKYDCAGNNICLLIKNGDEEIIGDLTDVDVWQDDEGKYGFDLISETRDNNSKKQYPDSYWKKRYYDLLELHNELMDYIRNADANDLKTIQIALKVTDKIK